MSSELIERPRVTRFQTRKEMEVCEDHTDKHGGCDGCPHLRHETPHDVYCAQGYVWPTKETD